jgi:hypothetical protein
MIFKAWLEEHPENHEADPDNPQDWVFEEWKEANKLRNSSSRLKLEDDTWDGVPRVSFLSRSLSGHLLTRL